MCTRVHERRSLLKTYGHVELCLFKSGGMPLTPRALCTVLFASCQSMTLVVVLSPNMKALHTKMIQMKIAINLPAGYQA